MNSNEDNIGTQCYNVFYDKKKNLRMNGRSFIQKYNERA